jgi:hypothetical protein
VIVLRKFFVRRVILPLTLVTASACSKRTPAPPVAESLTPSEGKGNDFSFVATFSDSKGPENIRQAGVLINDVVSGNSSCYVIYLPLQNELRLVRDEGSGAIPLDSARGPSIENSQCVVWAKGFSATRNGNELIVKASLKFKREFGGVKGIYLFADNRQGGQTDMVRKGTWVIP